MAKPIFLEALKIHGNNKHEITETYNDNANQTERKFRQTDRQTDRQRQTDNDR